MFSITSASYQEVPATQKPAKRVWLNEEWADEGVGWIKLYLLKFDKFL